MGMTKRTKSQFKTRNHRWCKVDDRGRVYVHGLLNVGLLPGSRFQPGEWLLVQWSKQRQWVGCLTYPIVTLVDPCTGDVEAPAPYEGGGEIITVG